MNLQEVIAAIDSGKTVCWDNPAYTVIQNKAGVYIIKHIGGHVIGLTWADGITLNVKESDLFILNN